MQFGRRKLVIPLFFLALMLAASTLPVHAAAAPVDVKTSYDANNPCGGGKTIGRSDSISPGTIIVYFIIQNVTTVAPTATGVNSTGMSQWVNRGFWKLSNASYTWYVSEWYSYAVTQGLGWSWTLPVKQCEFAQFFEITGAYAFSNSVPGLPYENDNSGASASTSGSVGINPSEPNDLVIGASVFIQSSGITCPANPTMANGFTLEESQCPQGGAVAAGQLTLEDLTVQGRSAVTITNTWGITGNWLIIGDALTGANGGTQCQFNCVIGGALGGSIHPLDVSGVIQATLGPQGIPWTLLIASAVSTLIIGIGVLTRPRKMRKPQWP